MSDTALLAYLSAELPAYRISLPPVIDLPACKQQNASQLYDSLKPLFPPLTPGALYRLYPLTAVTSPEARALPDAVYGVLRSEQRRFAHAAVATVVTFLLEIRAASYASLIAQEDAVRAALNQVVGIETVDASDDYEPETATFLSQLTLEMATAVADVLLLETHWQASGETLLCGDYQPLQRVSYTVLSLQTERVALYQLRDRLRHCLSGWQASPAYSPLQFVEGEALTVDCSLVAWADTFTHTLNRSFTL